MRSQYKGRVCLRWKLFDNFLNDMGERPKGLVLTRINTNAIHKPENCCWATVSDIQLRPSTRLTKSLATKKQIKEKGNPFAGKKHSEETKKHWRKIRKGIPPPLTARLNSIAATKGVRLSDTRVKQMSESTKKHAALVLPDCKCMLHNPNGSKLSERMINTFLKDFPVVEEEKQFGRYWVDAYLPPPYHLAFEADGTYWHGFPDRKEHDKKRDTFLMKTFYLPVIRLSETEINIASDYRQK